MTDADRFAGETGPSGSRPRTRSPGELAGVGWSYGVPLGYVEELVAVHRDLQNLKGQRVRGCRERAWVRC